MRRARGPEPLPAAELTQAPGVDLQPRDSRRRRQEPAAAAGGPRRLPVLAGAARDRQVLRAAADAAASPGTMPGFNDVLTPYPYITNYGLTVNYTFNPTTFLEGTYGFIKNELAGGGSGGILVEPGGQPARRQWPDRPAAALPGRRAGRPRATTPTRSCSGPEPGRGGTARTINLPPRSSAGAAASARAPPNQQFPGLLNINRTQDFAVSLTKVAGRHTMKAASTTTTASRRRTPAPAAWPT